MDNKIINLGAIMGDKMYFILGTVFNHWKIIALAGLLFIGWSDVMACGTVPVIDNTVINCTGCK